MREHARDRWESVAEMPLTLLALLFLVAYAWPILDPDLARSWVVACQVVTWGAWVLFALDYAARLSLSRDRARFIRSNVFDLAVVALPILRPLRLLRLVTLLAVLNRYAGDNLRGKVAVYVAGSTLLILFVASLAVLDAERGAEGANISNFGDALWWAMTTVTTVGYGDRFPVTETGRFVAGGLMLAGIALLGVVTASLASWLVQRVAEAEEQAQAATREDVKTLTGEVVALRNEIKQLRAQSQDVYGG